MSPLYRENQVLRTPLSDSLHKLYVLEHTAQAMDFMAGDLTDDPDVDFQVPIESLTDMRKLPFCADCFGALGWAEAVYGVGAVLAEMARKTFSRQLIWRDTALCAI